MPTFTDLAPITFFVLDYFRPLLTPFLAVALGVAIIGLVWKRLT